VAPSFADYGWAEAGWHRNYTIGGVQVPATAEVVTPSLDALVADGIELNRAYAYKCCSPTRSAVQSGRHPYHVSARRVTNRAALPVLADHEHWYK
jgi:arylsulfatase B